MSAPARPAIRLDIGTLALPGVTPQRAARIGTALSTELSRLLSAQGAAAQLRQAVETGRLERPVLVAGSLTIVRGERPERTGRRLAESVARSLLHPVARQREADR